MTDVCDFKCLCDGPHLYRGWAWTVWVQSGICDQTASTRKQAACLHPTDVHTHCIHRCPFCFDDHKTKEKKDIFNAATRLKLKWINNQCLSSFCVRRNNLIRSCSTGGERRRIDGVLMLSGRRCPTKLTLSMLNPCKEEGRHRGIWNRTHRSSHDHDQLE